MPVIRRRIKQTRLPVGPPYITRPQVAVQQRRSEDGVFEKPLVLSGRDELVTHLLQPCIVCEVDLMLQPGGEGPVSKVA